MSKLESSIQSEILEYGKIRGWLGVKITTPSCRGWPDLYFLRRGQHVWMEVKREGEDARMQQRLRADELHAHGAIYVFCVDSLSQAKVILK